MAYSSQFIACSQGWRWSLWKKGPLGYENLTNGGQIDEKVGQASSKGDSPSLYFEDDLGGE